jgi:hypothetical protein
MKKNKVFKTMRMAIIEGPSQDASQHWHWRMERTNDKMMMMDGWMMQSSTHNGNGIPL